MKIMRESKNYHYSKTLTLILIMAFLLSVYVLSNSKVVAAAVVFNDLPVDSPNYPFVKFVHSENLFNGYPDGTFRPDNYISRAELAVLLCNIKGLPTDKNVRTGFWDVDASHWACSYIAAAVNSGLLQGYPDGSFKPEALVSRAQAASILTRLTSATTPAVVLPVELRDVSSEYWAASQISACLDAGIMEKASVNSFNPDMPASRGELARGLSVALTLIPENYGTGLFPEIHPIEGLITAAQKGETGKVIYGSTGCSEGMIISTGSQGKAELIFPDGSKVLMLPNSEIEIVDARGHKYIKYDGAAGRMLDLFQIRLNRGRIYGVLASTFYNNGSTAQTSSRELPWWRESLNSQGQVIVDMPFGQAKVNSPVWTCFSDDKSGCSILDGSLSLTGAGKTAGLNSAQNYAAIGQAGGQPSNPVAMTALEKTNWSLVRTWVATGLERIINNAPLDFLKADSINGSSAISEIDRLRINYQLIMNNYPVAESQAVEATNSGSQAYTPAHSLYVLNGLAVSEGTLRPAFNANIFEYTLYVSSRTDSITLTPTLPASLLVSDKSKSHTTINLDAVLLDSGATSDPIKLIAGEPRTVLIQVTAPDGVNRNTYRIVITRQKEFQYTGGWGAKSSITDASLGFACVDSNRNIYISDTYGDYIYKLDSSGQYISRWGGQGTASGKFDNPAGIAFDASDNVYVVDQGNNRVQKFDSQGLFITQWGKAGSSNGCFFSPAGVACDAQGNVYVADPGNCRIQKFDSNGAYLKQWGGFGSGDGEFSGPISGIAISSSGNVYVADDGNDRIQVFDQEGRYISSWGSFGSQVNKFFDPQGVAADSYGNIYVADKYNNRIQKFDSSGTWLSQWGGLGSGDGQLYHPEGITIDFLGSIYVSDGNKRIQKFSSTGAFAARWSIQGSSTEGQFDNPEGIAHDATGNIYIADTDNNRLQKFDSNGNFICQWGVYGSGEGQFNHPRGIVVDKYGYVYVLDTNNSRVQKFDSTGKFLDIIGGYGSGRGQFDHPQGIAVDSAGFLYIADTGNKRIQTFHINGSVERIWGSTGDGDGQFLNPVAVAVSSSGKVFVLDDVRSCVQVFDSSGALLSSWSVAGSDYGQIKGAQGICLDEEDNVFIADTGNNRIEMFNPDGVFMTCWGAKGAANVQFENPKGVTIDNSGTIYVLDTGNNRIQKYKARKW